MTHLMRACALVALAATLASGHTLTREEIIGHLNSPEIRERLGIERAAQHEKLARMLVVRVTERWLQLPEDLRRARAAEWLALWRHSVRGGLVAVLDAKTGKALVNYRPDGSVELLDPPASP